MKPDIEKLRKKYMDNSPEGMTSEDIRRMSKDDLLDMDCSISSKRCRSPQCISYRA